MQKEYNPDKGQGIVLDAIDGVNLQDYCIALGSIIQPINIKFISRIAQKRICFYLSSKELFEKLLKENITLKIKGYDCTLRPLFSRHKRLLLSNVQPIIPSSVLEQELLKYGVIPVSKITMIKASITTAGYSHILSFRRSVYIKEEDVDKLPSLLKVTYDGLSFWIYLTSETINEYTNC